MGKSKKTNALRILESSCTKYNTHTYEVIENKTDGLSVAQAIGCDPAMMYKTLVTYGTSREHYVFIVPVGETLNLKKAAKAAGEKKVEMIPAKTLLAATGYVHGGCSPIGMKKKLKTFIHESALTHEQIFCSAGKKGLQMELATSALISVAGAKVADLC